MNDGNLSIGGGSLCLLDAVLEALGLHHAVLEASCPQFALDLRQELQRPPQRIVVLHEGLLEPVRLAVGRQALDRGDLSTFRLGCQHQAGTDRQ